MKIARTDRGEIIDLAAKYAAISRLRRKEEAEPVRAMRALSHRYPGALRELDELPLSTIDAKIAELAALLEPQATSGSEVPLWVRAQTRFHALLRGALLVKRGLGSRRSVEDSAAAAEGPESLVWRDHIASLARPPRGRLLDLVYQRLATELGVDAVEARRLVFTTDRPHR